MRKGSAEAIQYVNDEDDPMGYSLDSIVAQKYALDNITVKFSTSYQNNEQKTREYDFTVSELQLLFILNNRCIL